MGWIFHWHRIAWLLQTCLPTAHRDRSIHCRSSTPLLLSFVALQEPLSLPFLKKYIAFAKQRFAAPELSPEASDAIAGAHLIPGAETLPG